MPLMRRIKSSAARGAICKVSRGGVTPGAGAIGFSRRLRHIRGARFTQWGEVEVQIRDGQVQLPAGFSLIWVKPGDAVANALDAQDKVIGGEGGYL
jgi:hypothetical protein